MKNLATCTPTEFFTQTLKIRHAAADWFKHTNILNIRKKMPKLPEGISAEEKQAAVLAQAKENALEMFTQVFEEYPDETVRLMALACFVEPEHAAFRISSKVLSSTGWSVYSRTLTCEKRVSNVGL